MTSPNLSGMKADISGLIGQWGQRCIVSRFSSTLTASKRYSGSWVNVASGTFWIQPIRGLSGRQMQGLQDKTSHVMFATLSSSFQVEDRIAPSAETYAYDVLTVDSNPSHQEVQLQRVVRT